MFLAAIAILGLAELGLYFVPISFAGIVVLMFVFFTAFNLLEAMLPSLISRVAPVDCRGTAMGFYSSAQFFGAFVGGSLGGLLHGLFGMQAVFLCAALGALAWLLLALPMSQPAKLSNFIYKLDTRTPVDQAALTRQLVALAGVAEAVVVAEEGVAYLKVDKGVFDESALP